MGIGVMFFVDLFFFTWYRMGVGDFWYFDIEAHATRLTVSCYIQSLHASLLNLDVQSLLQCPS